MPPSGWHALAGSDQLADHGTMIDRGDRATGVVVEVEVRVNSQHLEHGVVQVAGPQRSILRHFAQTVAGANDLATLYTATANEHRQNIAPVISPGRPLAEWWTAISAVVDSRRATEVAHHHDKSRVEHASVFKVFEERADRHVDARQMRSIVPW